MSACKIKKRQTNFTKYTPKQQTKIFPKKFEPDHLLADSSPAITNGFMAAFNYTAKNLVTVHCWAHAQRNINKRTVVPPIICRFRI